MMLVMMAADDRTEKPTPKKRRETREKGEVRKSTELNAAIT
ncbi:MAG: flagellar biosynthesis protein FlhB, partial [Clostridiaceae bacterium]|nr:flagellar biosynthesis protein FlhB [Clostridiaceae bacterium]